MKKFWILAGVAAYALHLGLGRDSRFAEHVYSRGLFVVFRWVWDYTLGLSPIPWLYLAAAGAMIGAALRIYRFFSGPRPGRTAPRRIKLGRAMLATAAFAGGLVFFFYALWGFNYNRPGIERTLGFDMIELDSTQLLEEADWALRNSVESRAMIPGASAAALGSNILPDRLESDLRTVLSRALKDIRYPAPGRVRVRPFIPGGWMMRFSGTGIYIPFFGEGYTAGNLLQFEKPFTMAHEMAHGYGITDEGAANFLAFLACGASSVPAIRYSGFVTYWSYALGELARADPAASKIRWEKIPAGIKADLLASRKNWERYRGPLMKISQRVYEKYLKSQGIREGIQNYSRFVNLVAAWRKHAMGVPD